MPFLERQQDTGCNTPKDTKYLLSETWIFPQKSTLEHNSAIYAYFPEDAAPVPPNLPHAYPVVLGKVRRYPRHATPSIPPSEMESIFWDAVKKQLTRLLFRQDLGN